MGLSALLVPTTWAMREPTNRGTSIRTGSTFFYVYAKDRILTANMGAIGLSKSYEQTFIKALLPSCFCNANVNESICL